MFPADQGSRFRFPQLRIFQKFRQGVAGCPWVGKFLKKVRAFQVGGGHQIVVSPIYGVNALIITDGFFRLAQEPVGVADPLQGFGMGAAAGRFQFEDFIVSRNRAFCFSRKTF